MISQPAPAGDHPHLAECAKATYRGTIGQEAVMKLRSAKPPVYQITGARRGLSEDVAYRQRRYVISMGIRTVCFTLAILVHGPMRFVLLVAALVVPYFAVVFANGGREPATAVPEDMLTERQPALEPGKKANQS
jgi:hypothetical protein